ncbi:MAG: endonuclease MutS2 [Anaerolineae bacterium]|nr:endonuclease MutS2 [Anaerolineae bacterium]
MLDKYLQVLEYPKVLARLAEHTSFSGGRDLALSLDVATDLAEATRRQKETTEARLLLRVKADVSLGGAHDVRPLLQRAERGMRLLPQELLDVESTLSAAQPIYRTLTRTAGQFPLLASLASRIEACRPVVDEVRRCITPKGEVADAASPELARARAELMAARDRLLQRLERMVTSDENAPFLQEPIVTQRSGRYVIPLRAECRGRIRGIVHDESASGATLFIEPLATVELNNELREAQIREEREVLRVLDRLTGLVAQEAALIERTVSVLAEFDLIFARARYAEQLRAVEPNLVGFAPRQVLDEERGIYHPGTRLRLLQARHPLLPQDTVVPIDVALRLGPQGYFVIVITGPNTGGKTVALKTVGLLSLMAQAGMHVPADEGTTLTVFDGVYADIGDEQSIEQSLSTFSSHMSNIIHILGQASERSLVLLDELGAGTDPVEGSALARSLLVELIQRGVTTMATTHHPELKVFAQGEPGVANASVEFDAHTLAPTYQLTIGLPGRSNAFAIAERLGLQRHIVERARLLVDPQVLQTEDLLREIKLLRDQSERQLTEAAQIRQRAEEQEADLRARLDQLEREREQVLEQARQEGRRELESLREEIAATRAYLAKARVAEQVSEVRRVLSEAEGLAERAAEAVAPTPSTLRRTGAEPEVGDLVWVGSLKTQGTVTGVEAGHAEVAVGSLRLRVALDDLEVREPAVEESMSSGRGRSRVVQLPASPAVKPELHLRGMRVEEAVPELQRYLDEAYLAALGRVRVVHGKGTGTLRRFVREELARHPLVASVRSGGPAEGGDGVTVVELVPR